MLRQTGLLVPIFSLPSPYGIGDLGNEAKKLIDHLYQNHVHIWQILPINPIGYGHSPYQPFSSKAGEPLLISLDLLYEQGYIHKPQPLDNTGYIDYEMVKEYKTSYFTEAFDSMILDENKRKEFEAFVDQNNWVKDYAIFQTFKSINHNKCWNEWEDTYKYYPSQKNEQLIDEHIDQINYHMFLQFLFIKQWMNLKQYANGKDIKILGDIPFYVGLDSLDVWINQEEFEIDSNGYPTKVAGVPPDYFSPTGQRWGNPIYNWKKMQENQYTFWKDRLNYVSTLFDIIRIDHFRAFDTYWEIPSSCPTAIEGEWILGPAYDFFDTILNALPTLELVAEDLGDLREEVLILKNHYHFPGMQVIQFHFDPSTSNKSVEAQENLVLYTGTHDNQTLLAWYLELGMDKRQKVWSYLVDHGYHEPTINEKFIHYCLDTQARMVIFPCQDLLALNDIARINVPGTIGNGNWEWRLNNLESLNTCLKKIKPIIEKTHRI